MDFDSVVVGAGPAGSTAARELARAGARVAIVDGSHPREKICGGGVTFHAMAALQHSGLGADAAAHDVRTALFEGDGRQACVPLEGSDVLKVFPRAAFDAALLNEAIASGAVHVPGRVVSCERIADGWTLNTTAGPVTGAWLLGADGASGIVRKRVFRPFARRQLSIAAGSFVEDTTADEIVIHFVDQPRGYLWSFPRRGHLAVGVCAQADDTSAGELHAIVDRWLEAYPVARGRQRRRYAWPIPSLSASDLVAEHPAGDRWMLLGDAAGLVDPITREGIFFALRSGSLAAAALGGNDPSATYRHAIRSQIHSEIKRADRLRGSFFQPRFIRLLMSALTQSPAIREVMVDLIGGRQPYAGLRRRLIATGELGLMLKLLFQPRAEGRGPKAGPDPRTSPLGPRQIISPGSRREHER